MNLILISTDRVLLDYWTSSLVEFSPKVMSSLDELGTQEVSIVFVSDTMFSDKFDGYQKKQDHDIVSYT